MKKRVLIFVVILMLALSVPAFATQTRALDILPELSFNGTDATCTVMVSGDRMTDEISVDIELWRGNRRLESWHAEGFGFVSFSDTAEVTQGESYTMKVYVTYNGVSKPMVSISDVCPRS